MTHQTARFVCASLALAAAAQTGAVGTPAGTAIDNQAEISFELDGAARRLTSNVASLRVAEVLDVNLLLQTPERLVGPGATAQPLVFTLTNTGNGDEAFVLSATATLPGDQFDPVLGASSIYIDVDRDGDLGAADIAYVPGSNEPLLAADDSVDLLLVSAIPPSLADGDLGFASLTVEAATGTGAPGQTYAGGSSGVDAVVGASGARRVVAGQYLVGEIALDVQKSAVLRDPDGGTQAVPGASIDYRLQVVATGTGRARDTLLADVIPASTRYLAGSLRLNGAPLTDADDGDAGRYSATSREIAVALGELGVGDPAQQVQFTVIIE